jgi:hypothetical protein
VFTKPLSSNCLFRVATGICLAKRCLADGHIPDFRRHVTIFNIQFLRSFQNSNLFTHNDLFGKSNNFAVTNRSPLTLLVKGEGKDKGKIYRVTGRGDP